MSKAQAQIKKKLDQGISVTLELNEHYCKDTQDTNCDNHVYCSCYCYRLVPVSGESYIEVRTNQYALVELTYWDKLADTWLNVDTLNGGGEYVIAHKFKLVDN